MPRILSGLGDVVVRHFDVLRESERVEFFCCETTFPPETLQRLRDMGHDISLEAPDNAFGFGGAQLIHRLPERGYVAGSDPRKDGHAAGF